MLAGCAQGLSFTVPDIINSVIVTLRIIGHRNSSRRYYQTEALRIRFRAGRVGVGMFDRVGDGRVRGGGNVCEGMRDAAAGPVCRQVGTWRRAARRTACSPNCSSRSPPRSCARACSPAARTTSAAASCRSTSARSTRSTCRPTPGRSASSSSRPPPARRKRPPTPTATASRPAARRTARSAPWGRGREGGRAFNRTRRGLPGVG